MNLNGQKLMKYLIISFVLKLKELFLEFFRLRRVFLVLKLGPFLCFVNYSYTQDSVGWPSSVRGLSEYRNTGSKEEWINLESNFPPGEGGLPISGLLDIDEWPRAPTKGTILYQEKNGANHRVRFEKYPFAEGLDTFIWSATDTDQDDKNFTLQFNIIGTRDPLILLADDATYADGGSIELSIEEEQNFVSTLFLWDPDPELASYSIDNNSTWPRLFIDPEDSDDDRFSIVRTSIFPVKVNDSPQMNGWKQTYTLKWKNSAPNYEETDKTKFQITLRGEDFQDGSRTWNLTINLEDKPEAPIPVSISPQNDPLFLNFSTTSRPFPSDSNFLQTKDATYLLQEDSAASIIVPFKILSPDLDETKSNKDIQIWYDVDRPFDIENNSSWSEIEEVSVQFVKPARFKVIGVDTNGAITSLENTYPGFGYTGKDLPIELFNESNTSGAGVYINVTPLNGDFEGMLINQDIEFEEPGAGYKEGDTLVAATPGGTGFKRLLEGEQNASSLVPSLSDGILKIKYLGENAFTPKTIFKFFAQDEEGNVQTDKSAKSQNPFFTASVTIENDYKDPIELSLRWPRPENDGVNNANIRYYLENSTELIADFDAVDPDSWPVDELRLDNNKSDIDGARIIYDLKWADPDDDTSFTAGVPFDYFTIGQNGQLSFINPPDFDTLFPNNTFRLKVEVSDASAVESNMHKRTTSFQLIDITVEKVDEPNFFINSRYEPADPPTYFISLLEDGSFEWRLSSYDLNGTQMRLVAKDLDYENENNPEKDDYEQPKWSVEQEPLKGTVILSPEIDETNYESRKWSIPSSLRYDASPNKIGSDEFSLSYGGVAPVKFQVNIINQPDKPILKEIYTISGIGEEKPLDFNESSNQHYLLFNENELPHYRLTFADEEDNDAISRLEVKKGSGDEKMFNVTEMQVGIDGFAFIEVSLKELADFDEPSDEGLDNTYEITVVVEDNSTKSPPNNYKFILLNQGVDEGPKITLPELFANEEQKIAAAGIYAEDPEGEDKNFTWSIKRGEGNSTYFELSATQGKMVDLLFKDSKIPSYEEESERDLNVTLIVSDGRLQTATKFTISLVPQNDPPFFALTEANVFEPSLVAIPDLNDHIIDEDGDFLTFFVNPNVPEPNDLKYFEAELAQGTSLLFKRPSDFEEKSKYILSIVAEDSFQGRTEGNITILVRNLLEPPQVRWTGDEGQDFSFDDPLVTSWHFENLVEDEPFQINELFFYDPEESVPSPLNLKFEIVGDYEGNFTILESPTSSGSKPSGRFLYLPPNDGYTFSINPKNGEKTLFREPYEVELRVTDKDEEDILFTFQFSVEDKPDPPQILLNPQIDNNVYSSIDPNDEYLIRNDEGSENVIILVADDSRDSSPSLNYEWTQPYGADGHLFKIIPLLENQKEVLLKWDLDQIGGRPPDWANAPVRNPGLPAPPFYEIKVRLFGNPADLNETGDNTVEQTLKIKLIDLANQPPKFSNTSLDPYREGSASRIAGRVNAYDPDAASLEILNEPQFQIHYILQESAAYPDYIWFEKDIFDKDDNSPVDYIGGQLVFKASPDYEQFLSRGVGTTLEVLVLAREYGLNGYNNQETLQVIKVPLLNNVEPPFISSINSDFKDANFSLAEESFQTFSIFAETPDYDKNLTISISQNQSLDNYLFTVSPLDSSDDEIAQASLSFLSPPDRESPRDYNKDNIYEVELNITTSDPSVWTLDLIKIQVDDVEYPYEVSQDQIIRVPENQAFVMDIDVEDPENLYYFPDLLISNEGGTFYLSSSYQDSAEKPQFSSQTIFPVGEQDITSLSLPADFNNDGSADVLIISEDGAKIFINDGFGTFPESSFVDFSDFTNTVSLPKHGVAHDFDQDGDRDVLLAYYSYNGQGPATVYYFENKITDDLGFSDGVAIGDGWKEPRHLLAIDIDEDNDLDLAVADFAKNEVAWLKNDGHANFSFGGIIADPSNGLSEPRCLESLDLDQVRASLSDQPYHKPDLIIGSKGKLLTAENHGKGNFSIRPILNEHIEGFIRSVRAIKLDDDNLTDLVFIESDKRNAFFSLGYNNFENANQVINSKLNLRIAAPSSLEVYNFLNRENKFQSLVLLGSTPEISAIPKVYQFGPASRTDENSTWEFVAYEIISFPVGVVEGSLRSLAVADLDRAYNTYQFSIEPTLNFEVFDDVRIQSDGRLFFHEDSIPDYETPLPGSENLYRLYVNYFKEGTNPLNNQPRKELFQIEIIDVNEHPVLLDFNGTVSGVYQHLENIQSVGQVLFDNPESHSDAEQRVEFSIIGGRDYKFFDINRTSGELFFKNAPDRERPKGKIEFADDDHFYQVTVEVKENSLDEYNDTKTYLIEVIDGPENPVFDPDLKKFPGAGIDILDPAFGSKVSISLQTQEDSDGDLLILMEDLGLSDPNPGGSFTHLFVSDEALHGDIHFMIDGNETPVKEVFFPDPETFQTDFRKINLSYIPDANFSGMDQFTIQATSGFGIPARLEIVMFVEPVNDPPIFFQSITDTIFRNEGVRNILTLKGFDSDIEDSGTLSFNLSNSLDSKWFGIDQNIVKFLDPRGLDYEEKSRYKFEIVLSSGGIQERYIETRKIIDLRVTNEADQPPISAPLEDSTIIQVYEGQRSILTLDLLDPDGFSPVEASILDGFDSSLFLITQLGELMTTSPNGLPFIADAPLGNLFEVHIFLQDADMNNTYQIQIEVLDMDENPPVITSGISNSLHELSVPENNLFVYELIAEDIEKDVLDYSIKSGLDADLFELHFESNQSAKLSFKEPPNFEAPFESVLNNGQYQVVIGVSDGLNLVEQLVRVSVSDANDPPVVLTNIYSLMEDERFFEDSLIVFDEDNDEVSLSIKEEASRGSVTLQGTNISYLPDDDFYGTDQVEFFLDDGTIVSQQIVRFEVEEVNDPPVAEDDFAYFYSKARSASQSIKIDVLKNDHAGVDPVQERFGYTVELLGDSLPGYQDIVKKSAKGGRVSSSTTEGIFQYSPPMDLLGEDNFQYRLKDQGLSHVGNVKVWVATSASSPEWTSLYYFGTFYQDPNDFGSNWIFHTDIGWVFVDQPDKILEATWMWRESIGWFWTGDKYFKWVYHDEFKKWLHWERGINYSGGWFLRDVDENSYYEKDFIRFRVRNDIIEILPDLDALSNYIYLNGYFSSSEIKTILTELALRGNSPTLNRLLQFDFSY